MSKRTILRDFHLLESEIKLPVIDRIRLAFGARMFVQTEIGLPWKTDIKAKNRIAISKIFAKRHTPQERHESN